MDWNTYNRIWADPDLSPTETLVMLALVEYKNIHNGQCNPSLESLAKRTRLKGPTISTITSGLQRRRKLVKRRTQTSSQYDLYPDPDSAGLNPGFRKSENPNSENLKTDLTKSEIPDSANLNPGFRKSETKRSLETPNETPNETKTPLGPAAPVPQTYKQWHKLLLDVEKRNKRIGVLGDAFTALFPELGKPHYGMIGATAKKLNNFSIILRHFWDLSAKGVDCLDCEGLMQYILRIESNERSRRAGGYGEVDPDPSEEDRDQHFSGFNRV